MPSTFDTIAEIIADISEIPVEEISEKSHAITDLQIDSLDFLDIVFAIDKKFGIKVPLEAWTQDINENQTPSEDYFVMGNLCARIEELITAKADADPATTAA